MVVMNYLELRNKIEGWVGLDELVPISFSWKYAVNPSTNDK